MYKTPILKECQGRFFHSENILDKKAVREESEGHLFIGEWEQ
jgi:hypothetical protein